MNKIEVHTISVRKVMVYALITFFLIFGGAEIGLTYINGENIFIYAITLCVIVFSFLVYIINKNTFLTTFSFSPDRLLVKNKKSKEIRIKTEKISNYAIYYLILKKMVVFNKNK